MCFLNTMYGGKFLANGADTCVYDPPVSCDPPDPSIDVKNKVSRIVSVRSGEREKQKLLQTVVTNVETVFPTIRNYVNFATKSCKPMFKPEDEQGSCKVRDLSSGDLVNLITPKQERDLYRYIGTSDFKTKFPSYMMNLTVAMSYINEYGLIHTDLHAANIALMNGRLVAHDWGRSVDSQGPGTIDSLIEFIKKRDVKMRGEYRLIYPLIMNKGNYKGLLKQNTVEGKRKLRYVLRKSWDTLALIGVAYDDNIIIQEYVLRFLDQFVEMIKTTDEAKFSQTLRKIIPIAYGGPVPPDAPLRAAPPKPNSLAISEPSPMVAPAAPAAPVVAPVVAPMVPPKKTRKVKSKTKKTRKVKIPVAPVIPPAALVVPPAAAPVVPPVVPPVAPVVAPVVAKKTRKVKSKTKKTRKSVPPAAAPAVIPKSIYVSESPLNKEVVELRQDLAICDDEVDKLRNKFQKIAELTKLSPRP